MRRSLTFWLALAWALTPACASAFPVAAVAAFFSITSPIIASALTFVINTVIAIGLNAVANKLFGPKPASALQQRQASVLSLTLGEGPREAIFGEAATGGTLLDAFNFGGQYSTDWEVLVVKVADHKCDGLTGFYIGDTFYAFAGDGVQPGFNGQLEVHWKDGDPAQTASAYLLANSPSRLYGTRTWTSTDVAASMAYVVVAYKADDPNASNPVWPQGRPVFKYQVKGKRCYDPRKDSTVAGGSGAHRWADPTTWEWTANAAICDYNYDRGIYAKDQVASPEQLLIGRGLSDVEAPPERVAARANVCDEAVALLAGGTEPRYRVGGVIFANETFDEVKQKFADAMAGDIVKRDGGVEVLPGVAQSVVAEITDADLAAQQKIAYEPFLSDVDRVNTVVPHYIAPDQLWQSTAAPIRRSTADIADDGGLKTADFPQDLVTSQTQAQRAGEIKRRLARKEQRAAIVLTPPHADLEDGDWIGWTSDRYFNGGRVVFRIDAYALQQNWCNSLVLREIDSTCYDWNPATDEGIPGHAPVDEFGSLTAVALSGVNIFALAKTGTTGNIIPGIRAVWDTPVDAAIIRIRMEVREVGQLEVAPTVTDDVNAGVIDVTNGIGPKQDLEARLVPLGVPGRKFTPSAWFTITSDDLSAVGLYNFLWTIPLNYYRFDMQTPVNGAVAIGTIPSAPFTGFGSQGRAITIAGGAPNVKITAIGNADWGTNPPGGGGYVYAYQFMAATTDAGGSTLRLGFRDIAGAPVTGLADQVFALTTTPAIYSWVFSSDDPAFPPGHLAIFDSAGDIAAGQTVTVTDFRLGPDAPVAEWRPSPDEDDLIFYEPLIANLMNEARQAAPLQLLGVTADGQAHEYRPQGPTQIVNLTADRTLSVLDSGALFQVTGSSTVTLPSDTTAAIAPRTTHRFKVVGLGILDFAPDGGVTMTLPTGVTLPIAGDGQVVDLVKTAPNTFDVTVPGASGNAPVGGGARMVTASEDLAAGDKVNLHAVAGSLRMRKADNADTSKPADGFVKSAILTGAAGLFYPPNNLNDALTGLTEGTRYWLGATGAVIDTVPTGPGQGQQELGVGWPGGGLMFLPKPINEAPGL